MFSIFTPTNNSSWLYYAYSSLITQTYSDWEWVLIPNGDSEVAIQKLVEDIADITVGDKRVKVHPRKATGSVGYLKHHACSKAKGDVFVELDHDDILTPDCLESILKAKNDGGEFFYSDWCGFNVDGSFESYSPDYGWDNYTWTLNGDFKRAIKAFEPSARSLCEIFYAPNHVRAWSRHAYEEAGGYNANLKVADDHDLICRTYLAGVKFAYINKPLYLYRIHDTNTVKLLNADIQTQQALNRNKYIYPLIHEECRRNNWPIVSIDSFVDIRSFIGNCSVIYEKNSTGVIKVNDSLQLLDSNDVLRFMDIAYNTLVPGGWLLVNCPSTDGRGAYQDLRHKSFWNENSWQYFTNKDMHRHYYPTAQHDRERAYPRFQDVRIWTEFPSDWHRQKNVPYVYADLVAIKEGHRLPGPKGFN